MVLNPYDKIVDIPAILFNPCPRLNYQSLRYFPFDKPIGKPSSKITSNNICNRTGFRGK